MPKQLKEKIIIPEIQWAVICNKGNRTSVHNTYQRAKDKRKFLNEEYSGYCKHKIIKVKIIPL